MSRPVLTQKMSDSLPSDQVQQESIKRYYNSGNYNLFNRFQSYSDLCNNKFQRYRIEKVKGIFLPKKADRVLDLGCAIGTMSFALAPFCNAIVGVDYSERAIRLCRNFLDQSQISNIHFICSDASNSGLKAESFDVIVCADLFEHLYPDVSRKVLDECARLLRPKGKLVIWCPSSTHFLEILKRHNIILKSDISHVDYKSMEYFLHELPKRGFSIKKNYYAESHLPYISAIEKRLIPYVPYFRRRIAVLAQKE